MKYLVIPLAAIVFGLGFAYTALAADGQPSACTMEYAPVCAAHQVECVAAPCYPVYQTYSNSCMANGAGAPIIHEGECSASESGTVKPQPKYVPPKSCTAWFDGCNACSRRPNGQTICTMRACMVYNILPGKCTAYEKSATTTPPVATSTPATTTSSIATGTPIQLSPGENGIFHRFLAWLHHLFSR